MEQNGKWGRLYLKGGAVSVNITMIVSVACRMQFFPIEPSIDCDVF